MKSTNIRKAAAMALAGTMALSCASCALFGGASKKEVIEAADTFASALLKQDAGKIIKLTNEKKNSDAAEALEILFDSSYYSDDQNEFIDAVSKTITYEVDEDSVEVDKEEASVDVVFTMVDYESAIDEDLADIDAVLDALDDCDDTKEVTVTFEFEKDDDEWLLSNLKDKGFGKLFDFYTYELNLKPDLLSIISSTDIYGGSYYLDAYIYFTEDISEYDGEITFDVYCDGSLIASDYTAWVYGTYLCCDYYDPEFYELESGDYEVVVKFGGEELTTMEVTVDNYEPQPTGTGSLSGSDYDFTVYATGELADYVVATDWWNDDGNHNYYDTTGIEFDIFFTSDITWDQVEDITYNFYDEDFNLIADQEPVIRTNVDDGTLNADGYYYIYVCYPEGDFSYTLDSGYYYVEVLNPDGTQLYFDYCYVN